MRRTGEDNARAVGTLSETLDVMLEYQRQYNAEHREERQASSVKYKAKNREEKKDSNMQYDAAHREEKKENNMQYYSAQGREAE